MDLGQPERPETVGSAPTPPWERRQELGLVQAYFQTWKSVILEPEKFWSGVSPTGTLWDSLSFGWITGVLGMLIGLPLSFLQNIGRQAQIDQMMTRMHVPPEMESFVRSVMGAGGSVAVLVGSGLLYPVLFIIGAAILHLFCLIVGASKNGFNATARAYGYASAPGLLSGIPCINVLAGVYTLVLEVWGISKVQQTTTGRAAAAVLLPIVLVCCCAVPVIIFGVMAAVGAASR
jgi:hypothetical protein